MVRSHSLVTPGDPGVGGYTYVQTYTHASNMLRAEVKLTDKKRTPHLTLTRLKAKTDIDNAISLVNDFKKENYNMKYLAICIESDNGTCTKILHKTKLN